MNKYISTLFLFTLIFACKKDTNSNSSYESGETSSVKAWKDNKYSMFIHFGLYSMLGGIYNNQAVSKGYSEQIRAHGNIPREEYRILASQFNPTNWNADSIAQLAIQGGMKSIVITAKHHDGFCMYDSKFTDFSLVKASPFKRDIIKELSEACDRKGLGFGVYFSLIDWDSNLGSTISSHNADTISDGLHQFNLQQIEEICDNYGSLSEIWFDMGSLTLAQSKEIKTLVKRKQPNCMISGRLGNGQGDFAVMGDNEIPTYKMETPWQVPVSMFPETWGYRSWQERGSSGAKANEKILELTSTVSHGGNFLLNIGPDGSGAVIPFEKEVIKQIGQWLNINGEAIYGTRPFPIGSKPWGTFTHKPGNIYFHLTQVPSENLMVLYGLQNKLTSGNLLAAPYSEISATKQYETTNIDVTSVPLKFDPTVIVRVQYEGDLDLLPSKLVHSDALGEYILTPYNASLSKGVDGANYYSMVPSTVKMSWDIAKTKEKEYEIICYFTQQEKGRKVNFSINGSQIPLDLGKYATFRPSKEPTTAAIPSPIYLHGPYDGLSMTSHPGPVARVSWNEFWGPRNIQWTEIVGGEQGNYLDITSEPISSTYLLMNILCSYQMKWITAIGSDDAVMVWLNGNLLYARGYPDPANNNISFIDLPLENESNTLIIKHFNSKGSFKVFQSIKVDQIYFEKPFTAKIKPQIVNHFELSLQNPSNPNEDLNTPNIRFVIKEKKQ